MKKVISLFLLIVLVSFDTPQQSAFEAGEFFKFRIHYGFLNAGYATLSLNEGFANGKPVFHAVGKGYTTGTFKFFFKVEDLYESYFDKTTGNPYQSIRKINEGGYTRHQETFFNQEENKALVKDYKNNTSSGFSTTKNAQDIVSMFYYLRNYPNIDKMKVGESVAVDMFFDGEIIKFKLKYIGNDTISTKFGDIPAMMFRPLVMSGRVFKEEEALTVWISDDANKVPLRIKASLAVGSLKADLEECKGLKTPLKKL